MPSKRTKRRRPLPACCAFCAEPLDYAGDYWFRVHPGEAGLADGGMVHPHCIAYVLTHGPIPLGMRVYRTCGGDACVNPEHLKVG